MSDELVRGAVQRYRNAEDRIAAACLALSESVDDASESSGMGIMDLIEVVTDRHTKAAGELRRLRKAVYDANMDVGYLPDGRLVLLPKGDVLA